MSDKYHFSSPPYAYMVYRYANEYMEDAMRYLDENERDM